MATFEEDLLRRGKIPRQDPEVLDDILASGRNAVHRPEQTDHIQIRLLFQIRCGAVCNVAVLIELDAR